eukprot:GEZU01020528.1.p1 GENE.GEZU01020528.1~~GEZU01020528.1.p1  ORF type:complete len:106 (-),score=6.68 GEZU01020528.1:15-332(-)
MQSQQDPILFDTFPNGCRLITLNRPHALNALQRENFPVIEEKLLEWAYDKKTSLVVVIGAGDKAFCAGNDVNEIGRCFFAHDRSLSLSTIILINTLVALRAKAGT